MSSDWLADFLDCSVVCDLSDHYLIFGTLVVISADHLVFEQADVHDHHEANSTKELYAIESSDIGIRANRRRCAIPRARLICISRLEDVLQ